jgi:PLD-like domain
MDKLLPVLRREFPDFEAIRAFEAGIPVYFIRLAVEALEKQELTTFQLYFLHAVALGVNTREVIAHILGVDDRDLVSPGAGLLKLGYIQQGVPTKERERPILLTPMGQQALTESGPPPVPKRKVGQFHLNALTWTALPLEDTTWPVERMSKEGLFILPKKENERPTLGVFTEKDVSYALSGAPAFQDTDIIALLEMKKVELEYIAPVTVILLQHRKTNEQRLTIYRNGMQLRPEAVALQRFFENQQFKIPEEAAVLQAGTLDIPIALPAEVSQVANDLAQNENALVELETQLTEEEESRTETQSDPERQALEEKVKNLKEELRVKREESAELHQQLHLHQVEFLRTEQHRPLLIRALHEAQEEIIIISPWMNRRACNDELCRLIGDAIKRGVRICIGYGMGKERDAGEAARNRNNMQAVRGALGRYIPKASAGLLEMKETSGTHQKILVCDRVFAITGSFNWLSYAGERDEGYRNETGTLFRQADKVKELAQIALQALLP